LLSTLTPLVQETFQATFKIQVFYGIDTTELASDVAAAFDEVTQQTPSNITIPSFTIGASGEITRTGQSSATSTTVQTIGDTIAEWFAKITATAKSMLIALVAIVILAMILIAYGPNIGSVARAAV
jgi:hypothetical protein